ncbi:uncharacterized protein Bfra_011098 [Botrytis fragariae]|uniref:Uncharacterized protein n=1 Tax=Botrytis fragariae TaxID=1964551 RepID=A0A8H6AL59_9HELO|nr:uncharacterized protein Bfra_011098 [Botrytis fragariae]KAF5869290.1 hypothetical protein Bfra_011098 [Botrytis fragariae]
MAFANRESRAETLKHYHVLYQAHHRSQATTSSSDTQAEAGETDLLLPHVIHFNPKFDYLTLIYSNFLTESSNIHAIFPLYD